MSAIREIFVSWVGDTKEYKEGIAQGARRCRPDRKSIICRLLPSTACIIPINFCINIFLSQRNMQKVQKPYLTRTCDCSSSLSNLGLIQQQTHLRCNITASGYVTQEIPAIALCPWYLAINWCFSKFPESIIYIKKVPNPIVHCWSPPYLGIWVILVIVVFFFGFRHQKQGRTRQNSAYLENSLAGYWPKFICKGLFFKHKYSLTGSCPVSLLPCSVPQFWSGLGRAGQGWCFVGQPVFLKRWGGAHQSEVHP